MTHLLCTIPDLQSQSDRSLSQMHISITGRRDGDLGILSQVPSMIADHSLVRFTQQQ